MLSRDLKNWILIEYWVLYVPFADTKNSTGIVPNSIDEVAHNAVTVRWNPLDSAAKVITQLLFFQHCTVFTNYISRMVIS